MLQSDNNATALALCAGQNAVIKPINQVGIIAKWQYTFSTFPIWYDLPGSENAQTLVINTAYPTSPTSNTIFYRAVIYSQLGLCTGLASVAYSSAFKVIQRNECTSPDGESVNDGNISQQLMIAKAYPNPTQNRIFLEIDHYTEGVAQFDIMDLIGRVVQSTFQQLQKDIHTVALDVNQLANGLYMIRINDRGNHKAVVKFSKL